MKKYVRERERDREKNSGINVFYRVKIHFLFPKKKCT